MKQATLRLNNFIYRVPPKVFFFCHKLYISVLGPFGVVSLKVDNRGVQLFTTIRFTLNINQKQSLYMLQAIAGVSYCHFLTLRLKGIGLRVEQIGQVLHFKLGYSHPVRITIPDVISCDCTRHLIKFRSAYLSTLKSFAAALRKCRFPDRYKGQGILYDEEIVFTKEGKKS